MATMPGANEQPKARSETNEPREGQGKLHESTKHQFPTGHQSPGTPPGTTTYETPEPKRRESVAGAEPSANPKRAPEHTPGYQPPKQGQGEKHDDAHHRSQADDAAAEREAKDDEDTLHRQKGQRAHTAARKTEVKRGSVKVKSKKPVRKRK